MRVARGRIATLEIPPAPSGAPSGTERRQERRTGRTERRKKRRGRGEAAPKQ
jgi:hypothetical protein